MTFLLPPGCRPRRWPFAAAAIVVALPAAALVSCSGGDASNKKQVVQPPVPVLVAKAESREAPVTERTIGNVEAYSTVQVKPQIEGQLLRAGFTEGQDVKKGDLLFEIDPRPFEAVVRKAEADGARNQAELEHAKAEADRVSKLFEQGLNSKDEYEVARTSANALEAAVRADRATVENAKLLLEYCTIRSPIDGRTGSLMVHAGNVVKARESTLVTITQIIPIYVTFSIREQYVADLRKYMAAGPLTVQTILPGGEEHPVEGKLTFIDNTVDEGTGTIRLKATFENTEKRLWPGQFVEVSLTLTLQPRAVVVPSQAVQTSQRGQFVFVVQKDFKVEMRPVTAGRIIGDDIVVEKGLEPGETVVTDGQMRLVPGAVVEVKSVEQTQRAGQ